MSQELSEFTKEAMRMAREQLYNEQHDTRSHYSEHVPDERAFNVHLKESEWMNIVGLIDAEIKKNDAIIKKTHDQRSEGVTRPDASITARTMTWKH